MPNSGLQFHYKPVHLIQNPNCPGQSWTGGTPIYNLFCFPLQVTEEEQSANHTVMIQEALQQASVGLGEQHHLVVSSDEVEGIETVTVYTQGEEASEFIVYVQEAMEPVADGTMEHILQEI